MTRSQEVLLAVVACAFIVWGASRLDTRIGAVLAILAGSLMLAVALFGDF